MPFSGASIFLGETIVPELFKGTAELVVLAFKHQTFLFARNCPSSGVIFLGAHGYCLQNEANLFIAFLSANAAKNAKKKRN